MMMYSHILFDMDDTIFDFQKAQYFSFRYVLEKYNIPFTADIYHRYETINHHLWKQFDEGVMSKDLIQKERFVQLFNAIGKKINGE